MSEKILVTGGAGYIGSLLVPMLLERGYEVTILDLFKWGIKPILHFATDPKCKLITGDVRDEALMAEEVPKHDWVLHLAAIVGFPACASDPVVARSTNVTGTENVTKNMSDQQRLVYASTGSTYGKVEEICTEETPINPLSLYGETKWDAERISRDKGGIALRFATVFGIAPRLRLDLLVNDFVHQAIHQRQIILYEGHFRRTFLHAKDAAESYLLALEHFETMSGEAYNVGDGTMNYTKKEICDLLNEMHPYFLYEADVGADADARDYEVSYDKINALGYHAKVNMDEGMRELIDVLSLIRITNEWRNI